MDSVLNRFFPLIISTSPEGFYVLRHFWKIIVPLLVFCFLRPPWQNYDNDGLCAGVLSALPFSHEAHTKLCAAHNIPGTQFARQTKRPKNKKIPSNLKYDFGKFKSGSGPTKPEGDEAGLCLVGGSWPMVGLALDRAAEAPECRTAVQAPSEAPKARSSRGRCPWHSRAKIGERCALLPG